MGLFLGACLFMPLFNIGLCAVDSNSTIFDKNQSLNSEKDKISQPLALPEETPNPSPSFLSTLARVFLALAIIVGLIILTVWGVKYIWDRQGWNTLGEQTKPIKILTTTYLAPRKALHLIEVGKRLLVVGVGNDEINCLDVITEPGEVEFLRQATQQGFPKVFSRVLQKTESDQNEVETKKMIEESNQLVGVYVEKLKKISKKKKGESPSGEGNG